MKPDYTRYCNELHSLSVYHTKSETTLLDSPKAKRFSTLRKYNQKTLPKRFLIEGKLSASGVTEAKRIQWVLPSLSGIHQKAVDPKVKAMHRYLSQSYAMCSTGRKDDPL